MSKYNKQRQKMNRRYGIKKASAGYIKPEMQPQQGVGDIAATTLNRSAGAYSTFGGGLSGGIAAGVMGAGSIIEGIANSNAIAKDNKRKQQEFDYFMTNAGATDPKRQRSKTLAKRGRYSKDVEIVEIEAKNGVGEVHLDENDNVLNEDYGTRIGDKSHKQDGNLVAAGPGHAIIPVQGNAEAKRKVIGLAKASRAGNKYAKDKLQAIKDSLPDSDDVQKAQRGLTVGGITTMVDDNYRVNDAGLPVDENGNEISTPQQEVLWDEYSGMPRGEFTQQEAQDYVMSGKHNWQGDELKNFASDNNLSWTGLRQAYLDQNPNASASDFGAGTTDAADNWGPMTSGVFSQNYQAPSQPTGTLSSPVGRLADIGSDVTLPTKPSSKEPVDNSAKKGKSGKPNAMGDIIDEGLRHANVLTNLFYGTGDIEKYTPTQLNLKKNRYLNTAPQRLKEVTKAQKVLENNRRQMVGSRGQQTAQAAQDQIAVTEMRDKILADEIAREHAVSESNVGLTNKERVFDAQQAMIKQDTDRQARASKRQHIKAAAEELSTIAEDRMLTRSEKRKQNRQDQVNEMKANLLYENAGGTHQTSGLVFEDGEYNPDAVRQKFKYKKN